ncbi:hypothetical protein QJQ45_000239 [Haematococcus lacustris]|nr:hypothetical protein QJQ45_000239 [Haematococcus lacustris]
MAGVTRGCVICYPNCLHAASIRHQYRISYPNPLAKAGQLQTHLPSIADTPPWPYVSAYEQFKEAGILVSLVWLLGGWSLHSSGGKSGALEGVRARAWSLVGERRDAEAAQWGMKGPVPSEGGGGGVAWQKGRSSGGNVARYGRYFVTVMLGTGYVMLRPLTSALKNPVSAILAVGGLVGTVLFVKVTLELMLGTSSPRAIRGKEHPGLGYKRVQDKPPKAQQQQQQQQQQEQEPVVAQRSASSSPPRSSASSSSSDGDGSGAAQAVSLTDGSGVPAGASPGSQSVAAALARAQQALQQVESSLDGIEKLPSSRPPTRLHQGLLLARSVALLLAACAAIVASHAFGLLLQWGGALAGGAAIALWGLRRNSLAVSGAMAAFVVGAGTLGCSLRFGATLLAFYLSSSQLTQFKEELKVGLDDAGKLGGQRDWKQVGMGAGGGDWGLGGQTRLSRKQVLCNGLVPTCLAVAYGVLAGCVDVPLGGLAHLEPWRCQLATLLGGAFLGYYACCCGDTWASELGPLSSASLMGGMWVGAVFYAAALVSPTLWIFEGQHAAAAAQWRLIPLGLMAGLVGSVVDSLLGATLQYSGFNRATGRVTSQPGPLVTHIAGRPWLDNNAVNMLSASLTAALTALATLKTFGG